MNSEERRLCLFSNYGRWLGWEVWLDNNHVCSLNFHSSQDYEWDCYVISHAADGCQVRDDGFWDNELLIMRSRISTSIIVRNCIVRWDQQQSIVRARGLYVSSIKWSFLDRLDFVARLSRSKG